jgi:hypothetical protein
MKLTRRGFVASTAATALGSANKIKRFSCGKLYHLSPNW